MTAGKFKISFEVQLRVIKALFAREMISHFGRKNIGFLWMFIEPMMFTIGITLLWSFNSSGHKFGTIPAAGFALTGYSAIVGWRSCLGKTSIAVQANKGLLYHRQITVLDIALTRGLFEYCAVSISFLVLSIIFTLLDLTPAPTDILKVIAGWLLLGWFFISSGLISLYINAKSVFFHRVWHVIMYLTLPLTGAFSMVDWMPKSIQDILLLSPMVNGLELLREGYFGYGIHAKYSIAYLVACNLAITFAGLVLIKQVKKFHDH